VSGSLLVRPPKPLDTPARTPRPRRLLDTDSREIGAMLRHPAAGGQVKGCAEAFPHLELSAQVRRPALGTSAPSPHTLAKGSC
jgi:hypothetical protein